MSDETTPQDDAAMSPASTGSVTLRASDDPDRMLAARLHGIADHSMSIIIGNMIQEMITELEMRKSPGHPGHISLTLTDAERQALEVACQDLRHTEEVATLRALLERTK